LADREAGAGARRAPRFPRLADLGVAGLAIKCRGVANPTIGERRAIEWRRRHTVLAVAALYG
jgi:hypothetical protein